MNHADLSRLRGKPVPYGKKIQLRHVRSNCCVTVKPNDPALEERNARLIALVPDGDEGSWLTIEPVLLVRKDGEPVRIKDEIQLQCAHEMVDSLFVRFSSSRIDSSAYDQYKLTAELNVSSDESHANSIFQVVNSIGVDIRLDNVAENVPRAVIHSQTTMRIMYDEQSRELVDEGHVMLKAVGSSGSQGLHATAYWKLESEDSFRGDVSSTSAVYRLRHISKREYLTFGLPTTDSAKDRPVHMTSNLNESALFEFKPVHIDDTNSSLADTAYYQLKYHMSWPDDASGVTQPWSMKTHVCSAACGALTAPGSDTVGAAFKGVLGRPLSAMHDTDIFQLVTLDADIEADVGQVLVWRQLLKQYLQSYSKDGNHEGMNKQVSRPLS